MTAVRWGVRLIAFNLLLHSLAFAQVTTADIVGRVSDSTGAVLPGATVTITNEGTRDVRTAPTTESGDYAFNLLPIGTYAVKVELQGFGTQNTRLVLSAGDRARFDAKLSLGQVAALIQRPGFFAAPYGAKYGWVCRDAEGRVNWKELEKLIVESYRRVAIKRMLVALDGE